MHESDPTAAAYIPAAQITQSAISSCKDANDAASTRYLPASQAVQAVKVDVLYFPAEHTDEHPLYEKRDPETVPPVRSAEPFVADEDAYPAGQVAYTVMTPELTATSSRLPLGLLPKKTTP